MKNVKIALISLLVFTSTSSVETKSPRGTCTYTTTKGVVRNKQTSQSKCTRKYGSGRKITPNTTTWTDPTPQSARRHHKH